VRCRVRAWAAASILCREACGLVVVHAGGAIEIEGERGGYARWLAGLVGEGGGGFDEDERAEGDEVLVGVEPR